VSGGNGTFTEYPSAPGPPISSTSPVPGNSVRPDWCRDTVSTVGLS
jgi:hypothetical protein